MQVIRRCAVKSAKLLKRHTKLILESENVKVKVYALTMQMGTSRRQIPGHAGVWKRELSMQLSWRLREIQGRIMHRFPDAAGASGKLQAGTDGVL